MSKYRSLINNTIIFAIGNFGNRFISFFLVPLYTFYLSTSEFGTVDLLTTTTSLLLPIFSFSIYDAALRFIMDSKENINKIVSSSVLAIIIGGLLSIICYPVLTLIGIADGYFIYVYLLLLFQIVNTLFLQIIRATNKIKLFTISSLLTTIVTLVLAILFLRHFNLGIIGYFLALLGANFFSIILLFFVGKIYKNIELKSVDKDTIRLMLLYSVPLIPNALMWWVMQLSDRYLVTFFLGAGANGLYAVANKIPNLLNMVNSIFFQAWQLAAIEESDSKEKSSFFNNVFSVLFSVMILSTSGILLILRPIVEHLISPEFYESWRFVPFLLISIVFSSFSTFLGTNYIAMKKTMGVLKTSIFGAAINIILNIVLIPKFGINGASFSTMISMFIIWILRMIDTRRFVSIKVNLFQFLLSFSLLFLQIRLLYVNIEYEYLWGIILFFMLTLIQIPTYKVIRKLVIKHRSKK